MAIAQGPRRTRPRRRRGRRTQAERSGATVAELVAAARRLLAEKGFAETSIEDTVRAAGVTRGALYHHFESKTDVFRAVFEAEQQRLAERINAAALRKKGDTWARVEAGCLAFLEECLDPGVQQIVLIDGFVALGWLEMHEIEYRYTLSVLETGIALAMREDSIKRRPVAPLAHLLFGGLCQAAMTIARAPDQHKMWREMRGEVRHILATLRS
jgi:AcrR family transcriptional regulator